MISCQKHNIASFLLDFLHAYKTSLSNRLFFKQVRMSFHRNCIHKYKQIHIFLIYSDNLFQNPIVSTI